MCRPCPETLAAQDFEDNKALYLSGGQAADWCPYCMNRDIEADDFDTDGKIAKQHLYCNRCKRKWSDVYKLSDVVQEAA